MVYQLLYFVERPLARSCDDAVAIATAFLGLRRFELTRVENKITGTILTLMNVPICLKEVHIITILSSLSFSLRSPVDDTQTQHKELVSS